MLAVANQPIGRYAQRLTRNIDKGMRPGSPEIEHIQFHRILADILLCLPLGLCHRTPSLPNPHNALVGMHLHNHIGILFFRRCATHPPPGHHRLLIGILPWHEHAHLFNLCNFHHASFVKKQR